MADVAAPGTGDYWCHQCTANIVPDLIENDEFACPRCKGTFVEEIEQDDNNDNNPSPNPSVAAPPTPQTPRVAVTQPPVLRAVRVMVMRGGDDDNDGDEMLMGSGLEGLLQRFLMMEGDPNRYGTPPAAPSAVDAMPSLTVTEDQVKAKGGEFQCPVCFDEFGVGEEVREMPCSHVFHPGCILPWLKSHSTCPVCRHQMPVADEDDRPVPMETDTPAPASAPAPATGQATMPPATSGDSGAHVMRREVTLSLPWSLFARLVSSDADADAAARMSPQR